MNSKIDNKSIADPLQEILYYLDSLDDKSLTEALSDCLRGASFGYPIGSPHASEDPEDILIWILRSVPSGHRLREVVVDMLENVISEFVSVLSKLERKKDCSDLIGLMDKALLVIQQTRPLELSPSLCSAAIAVLCRNPEVTGHDISWEILTTYQSYGVNTKDRLLWEKAIESEPLAALCFHSFVEMGAEDSLDVLYWMFKK